MTLNLKTLIDSSDTAQIERYIRRALTRAAFPEYRTTIEGISTPRFNEPKPLYKVIAKLLSPFCTQEAGGFETAHTVSQRQIEALFAGEINQFEGLVCGIEASRISMVQSSRNSLLSESAIVYPEMGSLGVLHAEESIETQETSGKMNRYVQEDGRTIWMGHLSSGTSDPDIFPYNRQCLLDVVSGGASILNPSTDVSFWDANFDCTDQVNTKLGMESTLEILLEFTKQQCVQFIIPAVRVRKCRYADRPFANNQLHKGGIEQLAESMIATCPRDMTVTAVDTDGLFVLSEGSIHFLLPNQSPKRMDSIMDMRWQRHDTFSPEVILDHKPIRVDLGGQKYTFHNFMDFKGSIGVAATSWYDPNRLREEEVAFMNFLRENYVR